MGGYPGGLPIITWLQSIQIPVGSIWGYTTHLQLKSDGHYDHGDRTYCLDEDDLIDDLNILWVARQLCPQERLRAQLQHSQLYRRSRQTYCSVG